MAFSPKSRTVAAGEQVASSLGCDAAGATPDALRVMVATIVQEVLRAEFDRFVGAGRSDHLPAN